MRLFGVRFSAKKAPRWASPESVLALSEIVQAIAEDVTSLANAVEAQRKRLERGLKKEVPDGEETIPPVVPRALHAGDILSPQEINSLFGGQV